MSHNLRTASLTTRVVLAVAFTLPAISYASAQQIDQQSYLDQIYRPGVNDAFGSQQEDQVLRAARATPSAPLTSAQQQVLDKQFKLGQNDAFGSADAPQGQQLQKEYARTASNAPTAVGKPDLLGDGGHQDALARQMFPLGTAANDW